ncbi:aldehyde dehydrogenase family protein [Microterricola viridarii]|uniref:Aldehyde dehydrogenase n=1 Tax=Microterricola viridarii TaxID=412690 RepID=A0A0Y0Q951_9MICO|nr:aldehyde dehydrogenase family protein [Microterricola viridarii]AMB60011.1 aldehyde dehydrogenase [Microterricola viridarii]
MPTPPRQQLYIDGQFTDGTSGTSVDVISPVNGERIATLPVPSQADLDRAVTAARDAQREWRQVGVWQRAAVCHRIGDEILKRADELARLQTLEQGKPLAESLADIKEAAALFHLHAEDAVRLHGETFPSNDTNKRMWTFYKPVGTWAIITPWNFPVLMMAEFVAPGLATGNSHVLKPPTHTSLTVLAVLEAFEAAGLPKGLINVLPGEGDFGTKLVTHPGIDAIGFIGSSATGEKINAISGLKRSIMELSGNGPLIVLEDADLQRAAQAAADGAYFCAGQVCCATERVLVHANVHDAFVEELLKTVDGVTLGNPFDAATNLGPLNNEGVAAKMDRHMADARARGFDVLAGGGRRAGFQTDLYYEFTIVDGVSEDSLLSVEESFGPVVPVITGSSDDELLRIANADKLGLQSAVFTNDLSKAYRFVEEIETGQVIVNDSNGFWDINMPFGGAGGKGTGWGRIGGKHTLLDMSDLRTGVIHLNR